MVDRGIARLLLKLETCAGHTNSLAPLRFELEGSIYNIECSFGLRQRQKVLHLFGQSRRRFMLLFFAILLLCTLCSIKDCSTLDVQQVMMPCAAMLCYKISALLRVQYRGTARAHELGLNGVLSLFVERIISVIGGRCRFSPRRHDCRVGKQRSTGL